MLGQLRTICQGQAQFTPLSGPSHPAAAQWVTADQHVAGIQPTASLLPKSLAAPEVYPDHLAIKEHMAKRKELNAEKSLNKQACMGLVPLPRQLYLCSSRPLVVNNFRVDGVATIRHSPGCC